MLGEALARGLDFGAKGAVCDGRAHDLAAAGGK
jgi:hypothetical protein